VKTRKPLPKFVVYLFFVIGLLAATSFRLLIVFKYLSPELFRPIWYIGVLGYLSFFLYRFLITERRRHAIRDSGLIEKLGAGEVLEPDDKQNALYLLKSISASREHWNYLGIFVLSIAAIIVDVILASTLS
jgi:hypothetical protein